MDYSVQETFELIGKQGQKILSKKTVAIAGLGGVGSIVAEILTRAGVNLRIIERGRITEKDMARLGVFIGEDVGKFKAKQAKKRLESITKSVKIKSFHEEITEDNVFLLDSDMIIEATNDTNTRLVINKFAVEKKIPLVTHEFSGEKGIVLIVDKKQFKKGPCVMCLHKKITQPTIDEIGAYSPTTHLLASLVASAVIKNLLGLGNVNELLRIDMIKTEIRHVTVEKARGCSHCKGK